MNQFDVLRPKILHRPCSKNSLSLLEGIESADLKDDNVYDFFAQTLNHSNIFVVFEKNGEYLEVYWYNPDSDSRGYTLLNKDRFKYESYDLLLMKNYMYHHPKEIFESFMLTLNK